MWAFISEATKATTQGTIVILLAALLLKVNGQNIISRCEKRNTTEGIELHQSAALSSDNISRRYQLQICTLIPHIKDWDIYLYYYINVSEANCNVNLEVTAKKILHSRILGQVNQTCKNGSSVICYTYPVDVVINGCYSIVPRFTRNNMHQTLTTKLIYVKNNLTVNLIKEKNYFVTVIDGKNVVWMSNYIPILSFEAKLCKIKENCINIINKCTRQQNNVLRVDCIISPTTGSYMLEFHHTGVPWAIGRLIDLNKLYVVQYFNYTAADQKIETTSLNEFLWIYVVLSLLVVALCFVVCIILKGFNKKKPSDPEKIDPEKPLVDNKSFTILIVYASENSPEGEALTKLFNDNGAKVVDIQSAKTADDAAPAPSNWITKMFTDDAVKIVLLQKKRSSQLDDLNIIPIRTFGDTLVQYCLRLMTDTPELPNAYKKLFLIKFPGASEYHNQKHIVGLTRFIITEAAENLLLYTDVISDVSNAKGTEYYYKTISEWYDTV